MMKKHIRDVGRINATENLKNKEAQLYTRFIIKTDGKGYYEVGGHLVPKERFEKMYPICIVHQRPNCHKSRLWMSDQKAY